MTIAEVSFYEITKQQVYRHILNANALILRFICIKADFNEYMQVNLQKPENSFEEWICVCVGLVDQREVELHKHLLGVEAQQGVGPVGRNYAARQFDNFL